VLIVLQVAIIGIIAVGVTQVIITTGIDLSSGSVIALAAVVAASLRKPPIACRRCSRRWLTCRRSFPFAPGLASG
jgi:inositol transport system permease protein